MTEKSVNIEFLNKEYGPNDTYRVLLKVADLNFQESSFFPSTWEPRKVIQQITEAAMSADYSKLYPEIGACLLRGKSQDGFEIEFIFDLKKEEVTHFYPVHEIWQSGTSWRF